MVPAFCEDARGAWETAASGTLHHGLRGVRVGPVPAIPTGTMALLGAAVGEGVERVVRSQLQAADAASIWRPSGSITMVESRPLTLARLAGVRGVVGAWAGTSGLRREAAGRFPRPRKRFLGVGAPRFFLPLGHVTRLQNIFG